MLRTDEVLKNNFVGPFDRELVGRWFCEETKETYLFDEKGNFYLFTNDGYFPKLLGQWWYDYPDDKFENPLSTGNGEIQWRQNSIIKPISLKSGDDILIIKDKMEKRLVRIK